MVVERTTANAAGEHMNVGQCCIEAESADANVVRCYFEATRINRNRRCY